MNYRWIYSPTNYKHKLNNAIKCNMVLSMQKWMGKVAVVTGASVGIGVAIAEKLIDNGMVVSKCFIPLR